MSCRSCPFSRLGRYWVCTPRNSSERTSAEGEEWNFTRAERGLIAGRAVWFYARKLVLPYPLIFFYHRWHIDDHQWWQYLFPAAALALVAALWLARKNRSWPAGGGADLRRRIDARDRLFQRLPVPLFVRRRSLSYHASLALIALAAAGTTLSAQRLSATGRAVACRPARRWLSCCWPR